MRQFFNSFFFIIIFHGYGLGQSDMNDLIGALLADTPIEEDLQELCDEIGGRVTGSETNERSVEWSLAKFQQSGIKAWKDPFLMPVLWLPESTACRITGIDFQPLVVAKYNTTPGNYKAPLIYAGMGTAEELDKISVDRLTESFILVETELCLDINGLFAEYTHAAQVEAEAEKRGIKGIVFMSSRPNKLLYRYVTSKSTEKPLPQIVMAREDANRCARVLQNGTQLTIDLTVNATVGESFTSHNVIAEIPGTEKPEEVVIIGSHLDSWALGTGANDNGCNVSLMIDIARQMTKLGIKPKRTIRFALWNGEEQGFHGSWDYTKDYEETMDDHIMAMSIDIGSGAITGFFTNGREELISIVDKTLKPVAALGDFTQLNLPIVGTDNFDFMMQGVPNLVGIHMPQVYGLNYHAASDTYDKVDLKQLKVNSAIVAVVTLGFANLDDETAVRLKRHTRADIQQIIDHFQMEFSMRMMNVWNPWVNGVRGRK